MQLNTIRGAILGLFLLNLAACDAERAARIAPAWRAPIASTSTPVVGDAAVFVSGFRAGHPGEPNKLYAFEAATGVERWSRELPIAKIDALAGTRLFWRDTHGKINMLDTRSGKEIASADAPESLVFHNASMFAVDRAGKLRAVDTDKSKLAWQTQTPSLGEKCSWGTVRAANEVAVVVIGGCFPDSKSTDNMSVLSVYQRDTGEKLWQIEIKNDETFGNAPLLGGAILYQDVKKYTTIHGDKGNTSFAVASLRAYDAVSGKLKWTLEPGGNVAFRTPQLLLVDTFGNDTKGNYLNYKRGIDPVSGKELWRADLGLRRAGISALLPRGDLAWATLAEKDVDLRSEYTGDVTGSKIYAGLPNALSDSSLVGIDFKTGKIVWQSDPLKSSRVSGVALGEGMAFMTTIAEMKNGASGLWAFRLP